MWSKSIKNLTPSLAIVVTILEFLYIRHRVWCCEENFPSFETNKHQTLMNLWLSPAVCSVSRASTISLSFSWTHGEHGGEGLREWQADGGRALTLNKNTICGGRCWFCGAPLQSVCGEHCTSWTPEPQLEDEARPPDHHQRAVKAEHDCCISVSGLHIRFLFWVAPLVCSKPAYKGSWFGSVFGPNMKHLRC